MGLHEKKFIVLLCLSTDNYILACKYKYIQDFFNDAVKRAFNITSQSGSIIQYLNYHIIQSNYGISLDQTEHIIHMTANRYPYRDVVQFNTPLSTDKDFHTKKGLSFPSNKSDLPILHQEFHGYIICLTNHFYISIK